MESFSDEHFRFVHQCAGEDDGTGRSVAGRVFKRFGDFDDHFGGRMFDAYIFEDRCAVVCHRYNAQRVDKHLVHSLRAEGALNKACNGLRGIDVHEQCISAFRFFLTRI